MKQFRLLMVSFLSVFYSVSPHAMAWEENLLSPDKVFQEAYLDSSLLLIGTPNHDTSATYLRLLELLETNGRDENLKFIVLEGPESLNSYYAGLSVNTEDELLESNPQLSIKRLKELCHSDEWKWQLKYLMPKIRSLNLQRQNKLEVRFIDSMNGDKFHLKISGPVVERSCNYVGEYNFVSSINRERETKHNFELLYHSLKSEEKMIVVYHMGHLIPNLKHCAAEFTTMPDGQTNWTVSERTSNWFGMFLAEGSLQTKDYKLILTDEIDERYAPNGTFTLMEFIRYQVGSRSFAWDLSLQHDQFDSSPAKTVFNTRSSLLISHDHMKKDKTYGVADYLVWNDLAYHYNGFASPANRYPVKDLKLCR